MNQKRKPKKRWKEVLEIDMSISGLQSSVARNFDWGPKIEKFCDIFR